MHNDNLSSEYYYRAFSLSNQMAVLEYGSYIMESGHAVANRNNSEKKRGYLLGIDDGKVEKGKEACRGWQTSN